MATPAITDRPARLAGLPGDAYHFVAGDYFYALTIMFVVLAELYFVLLERFPAFPGGVFESAFGQIGVDVGRIGVGGRGQAVEVFHQQFDGLRGIGLGAADQPDRTALNPPGDIRSGDYLAVNVDNPSAVIRDNPVTGVKWQAGDIIGVVADRPIHRLDRPVDVFTGSADIAGSIQFGRLSA